MLLCLLYHPELLSMSYADTCGRRCVIIAGWCTNVIKDFRRLRRICIITMCPLGGDERWKEPSVIDAEGFRIWRSIYAWRKK